MVWEIHFGVSFLVFFLEGCVCVLSPTYVAAHDLNEPRQLLGFYRHDCNPVPARLYPVKGMCMGACVCIL